MIKKYLKWLVVGTMVALTACTSPKEILYLQDVDPIKAQQIDQKYEVIIHSDDMLSIMVNCKDEELALPFNMPVVTYQVGGTASGGASQRVLGYLVSTKGDIDFPILGTLPV